MKQSEFDKFAEEYRNLLAEKIANSGESPEFFSEYKVIDVHRFVGAANVQPNSILDFGGGVGNSIPYFKKYFPNAGLICADISQKSLDIAASRYPGKATLVHFEGSALPFPDKSFDVIFSACVFHHIPSNEHLHWLAECRRVAKAGAILAIFEHNPLNPLTVSVVNNCPFDENAQLLRAATLKSVVRSAGWRGVEHQYRIFFPNFLKGLRPLERCIFRVPLGAQYVVFARA